MGTLPHTLAALSSVRECARRAARQLHNQTIAQCTLLTWGHTIPEVQSQRKGWVGTCDKSDFRSASVMPGTERPGWVTSEVRGFSARPQLKEAGERGCRGNKAPCFSLLCRHVHSDAHPADILPGLHF